MKDFKQRGVTEILASNRQPEVDGLIITDDQGVIKSLNTAAQNLFGYQPEEVIDQPITLLLSKPQGLEQWTIGRHKNGQPMPISISLSSNTSTSQIQFNYVLQDLRKHEQRLTTLYQDFQANTEALKQRIEFEGLLNIQSNKLLSADNHHFASAMEEALQAVCEFLTLDHGYILKLNDDTFDVHLWAEWRRSVSLMKAFDKKFTIPSNEVIFSAFKEKGCIVLDEDNKHDNPAMYKLAQQLSPNGFVSTRIAAIYNDHHNLSGCIGFSVLDTNHKPNKEQLALLSLATQLLINAWDRHQLILDARAAEEKIRIKNMLLETRAKLAKILIKSPDALYSMDHEKFQDNVNAILNEAALASGYENSISYYEREIPSQRTRFINQFLTDKLLDFSKTPLLIELINRQLQHEAYFQVADLSTINSNTINLNEAFLQECSKLNIASFTAIKMQNGNEYLGFICFYNSDPLYKSAEVALNFLQLTVQTISSAIENHSTNYHLVLSEQKLSTANQLLTQQALQDALTGLPNRRAFDTNFRLEFDRAKRHKNSLTLLMCDIDYFKLYNDFFGHPQGDECLKQVAKVLQETFNRAGELATRYGGEEFAIILPSINRAEAEKQAQRLINNLEHRQIPHAPESVRPYVTMSIGIAQLSAKQDVDNYHTLLEAADDALYKAKENGRNQLAWAIEEE